VIIVWHICAIGDFQPIVKRQMQLIYELCECNLICLHVNVVGPGYLEFPDEFYPLIDSRYENKNPKVFEIHSINLVKTLADLQGENTPILYLNTRGVSYPIGSSYRTCVDSWSNILEHYALVRYQDCLEALKTNDTCSSILYKSPLPHYSGNMWWANSDYIKRLPYLTKETSQRTKFTTTPLNDDERISGIARHDCEFWLLQGKGVKAATLYNPPDGVCLYHQIIDPKEYIK
jgi:hypothetical protein